MEEAEAGATKQPTYPKVAVFNLGRVQFGPCPRVVEEGTEEWSTSLSGARFKWTDWGGGREKLETDAARGRGRGDTTVATSEEMRKLDEEADKHSNHLREPLHLDNRHAT